MKQHLYKTKTIGTIKRLMSSQLLMLSHIIFKNYLYLTKKDDKEDNQTNV